MPPAEPGRRRSGAWDSQHGWAWSAAIALTGLLITLFFAQASRERADVAARADFDNLCHVTYDRIEDRLDHHRQVLRAAAAMITADNQLPWKMWHEFIAHQNLEYTLPGIQAISYEPCVAPAELNNLVRRGRDSLGHNFRVWPAGNREVYSAILYIEPMQGRNLTALGFDMLTDPVRRTAMEAARDTDRAVLSGKVQLIQDAGSGPRPGTVLYMPVYRTGADHSTVAARRAALAGWVSMPYQMNDLVQGILGPGGLARLHSTRMELSKDETFSPDSLLYDSLTAITTEAPRQPAIITTKIIRWDDQQLYVRFTGSYPTMFAADYIDAWLILASGFLISLLCAGLVRSQANLRSRAETLAARLTADLQEKQIEHEAILQGSMDGYVLHDIQGRILEVNAAFCRETGYSRAEALTLSIAQLEAEATAEMTAQHIKLISAQGDRFDTRLRRKDASVFDAEISGFPLSTDPHKMVGFIRNVTERKLAERRLLESEARQRTIIQHAMAGFWRADPIDGRLLEANESLTRMFGYSEEELRRMKISDLEAVESHEATLDHMRQVLATGQDHFETQLRRKDGSVLDADVSVQFHPEFGPRGELVVFLRDITSSKQAERARDEALARLRKVADCVPGVVFQYRLRPDGTSCFPYISEGLMEFTGLRPEQVHDNASPIFDRVQPEDLVGLIDSIRVSARDLTVWNHTFRRRAPDGEYRWAWGNASPEREPDGSILWHGFTADTTRQRETEDALRLRSAALEAAANAIVITDREGRIEWANSAFCSLSGWSLPEVIARNPRELIQSGEHEPEFYQKMWTTILAGEVWRGEVINRRRDGVLRTEQMTITPLRDPRGEISQFIAIKQDITDQKALEQQYLHSQRMEAVGALAGGIAHDLNNMLVPVLMVIGILKEEQVDSMNRELLAMAQSSAQRGADVIKQLLAFSRDHGGERLVLQPTHLLGEMFKIMRETFPREIELTQQLPSTLWTVNADATQLHQVFLNLCVNARDAMPAGGRLRLLASNVVSEEGDVYRPAHARPGPYVKIEVCDTGHGIPAEIRHRIFDPFFTTKPVGQGTGLGLSTVAAIVRNHEGYVTVDSTLSKGTTFTVYLPAIPDGTEPTPEGPLAADPAMDARVTVLLVEDERESRDIVRYFLEEHNFRVLTAGHGEEAISQFLLHKDQIALVVTDIMMPVMNGVVLIRTLRAMKPKLKVVAMSGLVSDHQLRQLADIGVPSVLPKPYDGRKLLAAIQRELGLA